MKWRGEERTEEERNFSKKTNDDDEHIIIVKNDELLLSKEKEKKTIEKNMLSSVESWEFLVDKIAYYFFSNRIHELMLIVISLIARIFSFLSFFY